MSEKRWNAVRKWGDSWIGLYLEPFVGERVTVCASTMPTIFSRIVHVYDSDTSDALTAIAITSFGDDSTFWDIALRNLPIDIRRRLNLK